MEDKNKALIKAAIDLAYEAGKWHGQVELEEHYDREQFSSSMFESFVSKRTCMPSHSASNGRTVQVNLRSDKWRYEVVKSSKEIKLKAMGLIMENLNSHTEGMS